MAQGTGLAGVFVLEPVSKMPAAENEELQVKLKLARTLLQRSKPLDALSSLEKALVMSPSDVELLHLKGKCLEAANNIPAAFATFMSALSIDPSHQPSLTSVGCLYRSRGLLVDALAAYTRAHELQPDDQAVKDAIAVLLTDIGTKLKSTGSFLESLAKYQQAAELSPAYAPAHYNIGVLYTEMRQYDLAVEHYKRAVAVQPQYAEAHCNMGVIHKERGMLEEAIKCYQAALAAAPNFSIVQNNLAIALTDLGTKLKLEGRLADGIAMYERALSYNPRYTDALYNLGVAFGESGQLDKAVFMYELACHFNPNCAEAYNNLGVIYKERDNMERALECYMTALSIRPNFPQSLNNLGVVYTAQGRAQEALTLLTAAIQACPTYSEAYNNLGVLQRDVGAVSEAIASYSKCLELSPDARNAGQNRLLALNYMYQGEDPFVCNAHAEWGTRFKWLFQPLPPADKQDLSLTRPLRVGYISPDYFTHSVSYFAEAPLTHHRQEHVQHFAYCCAPKHDAKTARLKGAVEKAGGVWRSVTALSEPELASLVRADDIDILVELTGHTANNRLGVMAIKPAPIQVTWIGYPNSTGLDTVDYRFTDEVCDPSNTTQTFVEELVRLPGCFLCYTPAVDAPEVSPLPAAANGWITFGSFNNLAKITIQVIQVWARILQRVPRSRLVLKNKPFACETAKAHVMGLLAAQGIEAWRVDLLPLAAANADHLGTYAVMDISLDPFPYAGTTTTCESLYMGVPVVTLAGHCHAHNVGVSLLKAVGIDRDWVANSKDEYVELAVRHGQKVLELAELRAELRQRMVSSPLCDAPAFVERLEDVYRGLWHRYVRAASCSPRSLSPCSPTTPPQAADTRAGSQSAADMPLQPPPKSSGSSHDVTTGSGTACQPGSSRCSSSEPAATAEPAAFLSAQPSSEAATTAVAPAAAAGGTAGAAAAVAAASTPSAAAMGSAPAVEVQLEHSTCSDAGTSTSPVGSGPGGLLSCLKTCSSCSKPPAAVANHLAGRPQLGSAAAGAAAGGVASNQAAGAAGGSDSVMEVPKQPVLPEVQARQTGSRRNSSSSGSSCKQKRAPSSSPQRRETGDSSNHNA